MDVVVVDVGLGNLRSVAKAVETAALEGKPSGYSAAVNVMRSKDPNQIRRANRVVVPGQGAFRDCASLLSGEIADAIRESIRSGVPYLGICLGLQILFESSEEAPGSLGLGIFAGDNARLVGGDGIKIPHMGWNELRLENGDHPHLTAAGGPSTWVYFVHSYHAVPGDPALVRAVCTYGENTVTAAVGKDNVFATQFHPEKSQKAGLDLLKSFLFRQPEGV